MAGIALPEDVHERVKRMALERGLKHYEVVIAAVEYFEKAHGGNGEILVVRIPDRERRDMAMDYAGAVASMTDEWLLAQIRKLSEGIIGLAKGETKG